VLLLGKKVFSEEILQLSHFFSQIRKSFFCKKSIICQLLKFFPQNCFKTTNYNVFFSQKRKNFAVRLNRKTFFCKQKYVSIIPCSLNTHMQLKNRYSKLLKILEAICIILFVCVTRLTLVEASSFISSICQINLPRLSPNIK